MSLKKQQNFKKSHFKLFRTQYSLQKQPIKKMYRQFCGAEVDCEQKSRVGYALVCYAECTSNPSAYVKHIGLCLCDLFACRDLVHACDCIWHIILGDTGQTSGSAGIIQIDHLLLFLKDWFITCSSTQVSCLADSSANMCCLRKGRSLNSTFNWQPPEPAWIILPDLLVALKHRKKRHAL